MTRQRKLLIALVAVVGLVAGCRGVTSSGLSGGAAPAMTDTQLKTLMVANLNNFADRTSAIPRDGNGTPDIAVSDGVLMVTTTDPGSADSLCHTVKGLTNDPDDAGKPLPIVGVIVINAGAKVASC